MSREPIPLHAFALVLVRHRERFLLVEERDGEWYFPAGRVDPGESISEAAVRETFEEAGIDVRLTGIYRVEQRATPPPKTGMRIRAFFAAVPIDPEAPVKSTSDEHSRRAAWLTLDEIRDGRPLRGDEVLDVITAIAWGKATVHPLELLVEEARPWNEQSHSR
jgi:8-oxo-dGTP pyrophosphatase MutT (NUDIX family)